MKHRLDLLDILLCAAHHGYHEDLAGRKPEGPFAGEVLGEDGDEALETADDGAVDHHGAGHAQRKRIGVFVAL